MTVGRSIGSLLVCATLIPFYFQANQNQANHSFIHSTHQIKKNQTKPNQTKPKWLERIEWRNDWFESDLISIIQLVWRWIVLFNPIQSSSIQFNKVQFNSNSIYYKSKSNSISMISQWWLLDDEKCDDVNDVIYDVQNDVNMILCHFKVSKSSHFTSPHFVPTIQIHSNFYIFLFFLS